VSESNSRSRILAIHSGALGDCILFGQLLRLLPGEVTIVSGGQTGRLLTGLGVVGRAMEFNILPIQEIFTDRPLDQCALPQLLGDHDRLISCFAAGDRKAEQRLAAMCRALTAAFLPIRPPDCCDMHLIDLWADMLGLEALSSRVFDPWAVPQTWQGQARAELAHAQPEQAGEYVLIHPGAGSPDKCWPLEKFLELAARLGRVVFAVGPVELERWTSKNLACISDAFEVISCRSLEVLSAAIVGARCYVGNDSGVSHLAAAVGAPTVALFGPTLAKNFSPLGELVRTVSAADIREIGTGEVLAAVRELAG